MPKILVDTRTLQDDPHSDSLLLPNILVFTSRPADEVVNRRIAAKEHAQREIDNCVAFMCKAPIEGDTPGRDDVSDAANRIEHLERAVRILERQ